MEKDAIGLGVIGCGGFGLYALQHFVQVPGVRLRAMAGTHREASIAAAKRFGVSDIQDIDALVAREDIDLVYIATPPFLHHPQALSALQAGKHVICEKPLAMNLEQADEMISLARSHDLMLVANLMQRYNPLFEKIRQLIDSRLLGEFLHGYFENYATDEGLAADHWFWDPVKSGGIFIEHGVHFFDLFAGWLGQGRVVAAQATRRPDTGLEEHVQCTACYGQTGMVNFYHGFHQAGRMDRQEWRLLFERGDITLTDWVPTSVRIVAIANEQETRQLCELFPGARLDVWESYVAGQRACRGRGKPLDIFQKFELRFDLGTSKQVQYGQLLRAMMADQAAWVRDRSHKRVITESNGRDSLAMAVQATSLSHPV